MHSPSGLFSRICARFFCRQSHTVIFTIAIDAHNNYRNGFGLAATQPKHLVLHTAQQTNNALNSTVIMEYSIVMFVQFVDAVSVARRKEKCAVFLRSTISSRPVG